MGALDELPFSESGGQIEKIERDKVTCKDKERERGKGKEGAPAARERLTLTAGHALAKPVSQLSKVGVKFCCFEGIFD